MKLCANCNQEATISFKTTEGLFCSPCVFEKMDAYIHEQQKVIRELDNRNLELGDELFALWRKTCSMAQSYEHAITGLRLELINVKPTGITEQEALASISPENRRYYLRLKAYGSSSAGRKNQKPSRRSPTTKRVSQEDGTDPKRT